MVLVTSQQEYSDADFRVVAKADQSKKLKLDLSGLTTATTRTWTAPNLSGTVALLGATMGGSGTISIIDAGTYTPTTYNTTNVAASTAYVCQYGRIGNFVIVSGAVDIQATAAASTSTVLGLSLPVASNLALSTDLGGTAINNGSSQIVRVTGDDTNDRATFNFPALTTSNRGFSFTFGYQVI